MITILTTGSRGDVQPYLALGIELKKAGYEVRIAAFEIYQNFVESYGLNYFPIHGDFSRVLSSQDGKEAMAADNPLKLVLSFGKLKSYVTKLQSDFFDACADSELIVYHPGAPIGYFAAQYLRIPSVLATPFPMTPTTEYPALIFYDSIRLGKRINLLTHKVFEQVMWSTSSGAINEFWQKRFGKAPMNFRCPFSLQNTTISPTIVSCSKYVFPTPRDWSENVHNTGYWFLDEEPDWSPPDNLIKFLENGTPPIYIGFGSLGDPDQAVQMTNLMIDALKRSGHRGILATGWSGLSHFENILDNIFILESAPHSWLFPQMSAVIHHGGAGTTAAGLRAGVPSIVIPFSNDQFAWGRRVFELGVGPKPIPKKNLTVENLSSAIDLAITENIKNAAQELGANIRSENGAQSAAKIIIDCLQLNSKK